MQDKHSEFSALMVVALVLVAASAITQTAFGLQGDSTNASLAEHSLGAVVASAGNSSNPKIKQYTDQLYSLHIERNGEVQLAGRVVNKDGLKLAIQSWGGTWSVTLDPKAPQLPTAGALAKTRSFALGDFVVVNGVADKPESNAIVARNIYDMTMGDGKRQNLVTASSTLLPIPASDITSDTATPTAPALGGEAALNATAPEQRGAQPQVGTLKPLTAVPLSAKSRSAAPQQTTDAAMAVTPAGVHEVRFTNTDGKHPLMQKSAED